MVSTQEKNEMKRLQAILTSGFDGSVHEAMDEAPDIIQEEPSDGTIAPPAPLRGDPAMAKFLAITNEGFIAAAEKSAQSLMESTDPEILEALNTKHDTDSISIGSWKIKVVERQSYSTKPIKTYDIINTINKQVIIENLYVYEAARGIVRLLNKGVPLNHQSAQTIIQLETKYVSLREDLYRAVKKQKSLRSQGLRSGAGIYETRADECQHRALQTKRLIIEASTSALRLLG